MLHTKATTPPIVCPLTVSHSLGGAHRSDTWAHLLDDAAARGLSVDLSLETLRGTPPLELLQHVPTSLLDGEALHSPRAAPPQRSVRLVRPAPAQRAD